MKKLLVILLIACPFLSIADSGGGRYNRWGQNTTVINEYERVFNVHYRVLTTEVDILTPKGKEKTIDVNVNLVIYDVAKNTTTYLFETTSDESIIEVLFESGYNEKTQSIQFNNKAGMRVDHIRNNVGIEKRELSTKMIVVTYSQSKQLYTLWTCHKTGTDLKKVHEFKKSDDFDIDMYNQCFLFFTETGGSVAVKKIDF
jgi:hypothetical protein